MVWTLFLSLFETCHYFIRGVLLIDSFVDWLTGMLVAVVIIEIAFRILMNLQRELQRTTNKRKQMEEELRESEEHLRAVIAGAPIILFAINCEGRITFLEGKGLNVLEIESIGNIGKSVFDVLRDIPELGKNIFRARASAQQIKK